MSDSVLADTGPLYAALDRRDQYHQRALIDLARFEETGVTVVILIPTLFETYSLTMQRLGVRAALLWLAQAEHGAVVMHPIEADYTAALTRIHAYPDQKMTLYDTLVSAASARLRLPVWTYDHHFDALGARVWR